MILKGSIDPGFDWAVLRKSLNAKPDSDGRNGISGAGLVLGEQLELFLLVKFPREARERQ